MSRSYLSNSEKHYRAAEKLVTSGTKITSDILLFVKHSRLESSKSILIKKKARTRILGILEDIVNMQFSHGYMIEQWESILKLAVEEILKKDPRNTRELIEAYKNDPSSTKVLFAQKFMQTIGNVPLEYLSKPFHG